MLTIIQKVNLALSLFSYFYLTAPHHAVMWAMNLTFALMLWFLGEDIFSAFILLFHEDEKNNVEEIGVKSTFGK